MTGKNIILTGPPRSGTTLTCHLLNKLPDIVALHEPMYLRMFPDKKTAVTNIARTFDEMRSMIIEKGEAVSRVAGGKIPANPFAKGKANRKSIVEKGTFKINKDLSSDNFILVMKHNGHFTFMLKELMNLYPCYTTIRNPLAIIASWNSISAPVSKGNLNVLKHLDGKLYSKLNSISDLCERQVELLNQIYKALDDIDGKNVIKYEELVTDPAGTLSAIHPQAHLLDESLQNKNKNSSYDKALIEKAGRILLGKGGYWQKYYSEQEIVNLTESYP